MAENNKFTFDTYNKDNFQAYENIEKSGMTPKILNDMKEFDKNLENQYLFNTYNTCNTCKTDSLSNDMNRNHNNDNNDNDNSNGTHLATCKINSLSNPNLLKNSEIYITENISETTFLDDVTIDSTKNNNYNKLVEANFSPGNSVLEALKMRKAFGDNTDPTCDEIIPNNSEVF